jgi:hypothetical protein
MIEIENHYLVSTTVAIVSGKNQPCRLKSVARNIMKNGIFAIPKYLPIR